MKKLFIIVAAVILAFAFMLSACSIGKKPAETRYAASDSLEIPVYTIEDKEVTKVSSIVRGSEVSVFTDPITINDKNYLKIDEEPSSEGAPEYYIAEENISEDKNALVLEKECFVRTPVTVYKKADSPDILGFVKKGEALDVVGYEGLDDEGRVGMYKVSYDKGEGYVYGKYTVLTQEEADAVNSEHYDLNADKIYSRELFCGLPTELDYYPYDKSFNTEKKMPEEARTFYLNSAAVDAIDSYIDLAKSCGANAFVIDIKDGGLAYSAEVASDYCPTAYKTAYNTNEKYKEAIKKVQDAGIWAIGRIVVFNDVHFAADHPDECIFNNGVNQEWPSAYSRLAWEYNVKLATSAVEEMGFDEIQFDYVRFPENTFFMSRDGGADFKNKYDEEKSQAIQNFCFYAADQIHKAGAYFSVDVFGECSNGYVTAYGQYWPSISMIVDAISSMPYVDHFGRDVDTWSDAYTTVYNWAVQAHDAQEITPNPASVRTWLTCYDVPYWAPTINADAAFLSSQIKALKDAGVGDGGFITWNAGSSLAKYNEVAPAFSAESSN